MGLLALGLLLVGIPVAHAQITVTTSDSVEDASSFGAYGDDAYINQGGSFSYDIFMTGTETGVSLSFAFDSNLTFAGSATFQNCAGCSCNTTGNPITCTILDNPSNAIVTLSSFTVASPYAIEDGMLVSTATASWTSNGGGSAAISEKVSVNGSCFRERSGVKQTNICTAGDMTFAVSTVADVSDGCVSASDTFLSATLAGSVASTTADRYDISMYIATDGGSAIDGECYQDFLEPPTAGILDPPTYDGGPFWNIEGNSCGDVVSGTANEIKYFPELHIPCTDNWDASTSTNNPDGIVDVGHCASYHQNVQSCNELEDTVNQTSSKCICTRANLTAVTRPDMSCVYVRCGYYDPPGTWNDLTNVGPGWEFICEAEYTNTAPALGVGQYLQFDIDDGGAGGTFSSGSATGDTVVTQSTGVRWTPGTTGTFDLGEFPASSTTKTLTFTYTVSDSPPASITIDSETFWAELATPTDGSAFTDRVTQAALSPCSDTLTADLTWVLVSDVTAYEDSGQVVLAWSTAAEARTIGFHVERFDPLAGTWTRVNNQMLAAAQHGPGGEYRFADPSAEPGQPLQYRIVEVEQHGFETVNGPFEVIADGKETAERKPIGAAGYRAEARTPRPETTRRVEAARRLKAGTRPGGGRSERTGRAKIIVAEAGLVRVEAAQIAQALARSENAVANAIAAGRAMLSTQGHQVAWSPAGGGGALLFYGQPAATVVTDENVYWLELTKGLVMEVEAGTGPLPASGDTTFVATRHVEQDLLPRTWVTDDPASDYWFWSWVVSGDPTYGSTEVVADLPGVADLSGEASLRVEAWGFEAGDHGYAATAFVNGAPVGDFAWVGDGPAAGELVFPQSLLAEGESSVEIVGLEGDFFLDSVDLRYEREHRASADRLLLPGTDGVVSVSGFSTHEVSVYDVSDPVQPRRLRATTVYLMEDGSYQVSFDGSGATSWLAVGEPAIAAPRAVLADFRSDLKDRKNEADYLVITAPELLDAAERLAGYRHSLGHTAMVVEVEDVMDEFNHGRFDPMAIRDFLAVAHQSWDGPPRYVVLLGKGSYDYRNIFDIGGNLVPPVLVGTTWGLTASDNAYADFDADGIPEMAVGRIPVLTGDEAAAYVDKLIAYEATATADWTSKVLLVADNPDTAGEFAADSDGIAALLPDGVQSEKIYVSDPYTAEEARVRLLEALDEGAAVLSYVGHGGLDRLAHEGILQSSDVDGLGNAERLPVVVGLTCYINSFVFPGFACLGEELVVNPGGGAVAVWSSTNLSNNDDAVDLGEAFMRAVFDNRETIGDVLLEAFRLVNTTSGRDTTASYALFGDPAMIVKVGP